MRWRYAACPAAVQSSTVRLHSTPEPFTSGPEMLQLSGDHFAADAHAMA